MLTGATYYLRSPRYLLLTAPDQFLTITAIQFLDTHFHNFTALKYLQIVLFKKYTSIWHCRSSFLTEDIGRWLIFPVLSGRWQSCGYALFHYVYVFGSILKSFYLSFIFWYSSIYTSILLLKLNYIYVNYFLWLRDCFGEYLFILEVFITHFILFPRLNGL